MCDDILSKHENFQEDVKFAMFSIAISMKDMSYADRNNNGLFENEKTSSGVN